MIGRQIDSRVVFAEEALSVTSGAAVGFTAATMGNATGATVQVQVAQVRSRIGSTAPTATVGKIRNVGDEFDVTGNDVRDFKAIAPGATATLWVEYWR